MAVDPAGCGVILCPQLHPSDIGQADDRAALFGLENDRLELVDGAQPRLRGHRGVELVGIGLRQAAHFAGGHFGVLVADRGNHVTGHQTDRSQPIGVHPDAHRILRTEHVGLTDAFDPRELILQVGDEKVGDVDIGAAVGLVIDADDQQEIGVGLGDSQPLLLHLLRQPGQRLLDLVLHLDLGDIGIGTLFERRADRHLPART